MDDDAIPSNKEEIKNDIRNKLRIKTTDLVIITGGKIDRLKNTHKLMQAFSEINDEKIHLIIFGVVIPDFKEEFDRLLTKNMHYVGWCNSEDVINYMVSADLACFPGTHSTLWEEAVGLSLPCILKNWEGMHHVDINGNCLFLKEDTLKELKQKAQIAAASFRYSEIAQKAIGI